MFGASKRMEEIEIGLRILPTKDISFFGLEEVNELLKNGASITSIEPIGALTIEVKQEDQSVHYALTGFALKVKFSKPNI
jgi:hypothetical protein